MCENIDTRFPAPSCKVLIAFSVFDIDLLPPQKLPTFTIHGNDYIRTLQNQFLPNAAECPILEQWADFKFEMLEMKKKLTMLLLQL